jgi:hypothetical protein
VANVKLNGTQRYALDLLAQYPDNARMSNETGVYGEDLLIHSRTAAALQRLGLVTLAERSSEATGRVYTDVGLTDEGRRRVGR